MKYWTRIIGVGLMTVTLATAAHAAVGLQTIREFTLPVKPLDVALSPDGRLTFVLADNGTILVYAVDSGLKDTITVGPGIDRIAVADEGHTLVLTNSKTKQVRQVAVAFQAMIDIADSPFKGKKDAPIVLAVFSDFQCPHCGRIAPVLEQVLEHNPETVKIVFKNFPLNMHKLAMPAAQAAMAAHNLDPIFIFAPTTTSERMQAIAHHARGFVYCVARKGITGQQTDFSEQLEAYLARCRAASNLPLALGFGVKDKADIDFLTSKADVAVIGTQTICIIEQQGVAAVGDFIRGLRTP